MITMIPQFDRLVKILLQSGYNVKIEEHRDGYHFAQVFGKNIHAGFCTPNGSSYRYLNGHFAADHEECYNKWSQCPLIVQLPENDEEAKKIITHLAWLGTDEGLNHSDKFSYLDKPKLPKVL